MIRRKWVSALCAAAVMASAQLAPAAEKLAAEPTTQELLEQIQRLQAKVERLETRQETLHDSADVAETVEAIVKDAQRRSSGLLLLQNDTAALAGHEEDKFFIRSADGAFTLSPFLQMQLRNVTNYAEGLGGNDDSNLENGFELRRMKFGFNGTVYEKLDYKFVWAYNRSNGDLFLEDAVVTYGLNDTWSLYGGQFKSPVHHEELVSSTRQLGADRSLVNEELGGGATDRVQGVGLKFENDSLKGDFAVHDGQASLNTNFRDTPVNDSDYGVAGRVEYLVAGDFKPYGDFTARGNKDSTLVVGGGADLSAFEDENGLAYTVDAQWENTAGLAIYGGFLGYYTDGHGGGSGNDVGGIAQVAQMVGEKTEIFGRLGYIDFDAGSEVWEVTLGGNYYLHSHNAKFTADVTYLPEGAPGDSGLGILDSGDEAQWVGRVQFQLVL